ncbi:hypothetical protein BDF21DRAFT_451754 [Thamnidium elegans]|nr:hypothetical protein BDF21DRAFT_451754 [Thamnidium elegans]
MYRTVRKYLGNELVRVTKTTRGIFFVLATYSRTIKSRRGSCSKPFLNSFESQFGYSIDLFPFFLNDTFGSRTRIRFFELKFARLTDDDNPLNSVRSTFGIDQGAFKWLVNRLQDHEELQFDAQNAIPLWRNRCTQNNIMILELDNEDSAMSSENEVGSPIDEDVFTSFLADTEEFSVESAPVAKHARRKA